MPPPGLQRAMAQPSPSSSGGNLLPMEQWGHRYPNNTGNQIGLRPPNPNQILQGKPQMPQQQQQSPSVSSIFNE